MTALLVASARKKPPMTEPTVVPEFLNVFRMPVPVPVSDSGMNDTMMIWKAPMPDAQA